MRALKGLLYSSPAAAKMLLSCKHLKFVGPGLMHLFCNLHDVLEERFLDLLVVRKHVYNCNVFMDRSGTLCTLQIAVDF
jgi:hypothetical protein